MKPILLVAISLIALSLPPAPGSALAEVRPEIVALQDRMEWADIEASVLQLEAYSTRFVASQNAPVVAQMIYDRLIALGWETGVEEFSIRPPLFGQSVSWNIVARKAGTNPGGLIIVGAHYDSIDEAEGGSYADPENPAPGANDNGSGTAVLLELAEALADQDFRHDLELVFFGAEETDLQGSAAHAAMLSNNGIDVIEYINIDSVGYDDDNDNNVYDPYDFWDMIIYYDAASGPFAERIHGYFSEYSIIEPAFRLAQQGEGNSDARSFWFNGFQAVSLWEGEDHAPYGNDAYDTFADCILMDYFHAMARTILAVVCEEADLQSSAPGALPASGPALSASPNPFRGQTRILALSDRERPSGVEVFDVRGRKLRRLDPAGDGGFVWDGRDQRGQSLPAGIYLIRPMGRGPAAMEKVVLLH